MSLDAWQILGMAMGVIAMLVAAVYAWLVWDQRRLAKNIHKLRTIVQRIILTLAAKGIMVKLDNDDHD